jgi:hypothetical protein
MSTGSRVYSGGLEMSGKTIRIQRLTAALSKSVIDMLWKQDYQNRERNKTFRTIREDMLKAHSDISDVLSGTPGGVLGQSDLLKIKRATDLMKAEYMSDGKFNGMMVGAIIIDMIVFQLAKAKGEKRKCFERMYFIMNRYFHLLDKEKSWSDEDFFCLRAAETLREET